MDNVIFFVDSLGDEHAIIDHGNKQFTSMPKAVYDEMIAAQASLEA